MQRFGPIIEFGGQGLALPIQFEEHLGLVSEDVRLDGFVDEIHRAGFISFELAVQFARPRGDENQWYVPGALAAAQEFRELESVHVRHLHIEERKRHIVHQQQFQCFRARARGQNLDVAARQQRRQRQQILFEIIDQQALDGSERRSIHGQSACAGTGAASKVRNSSAISASGKTQSAGRNFSADSTIFGARAVCGDCTTVMPPAS